MPEISNPPSSMNLMNEGIKEIHADATNVAGVEERSKEIHVDANNLVEESSKAIPVGAANLVVEERSKEIHVDATNVVAEEICEEIHNDETILVAEEKGKEIHNDATNLTAEDIKSGPLHADEKVDSVENKNVMIEQLGNKAEKEVRKSQKTPREFCSKQDIRKRNIYQK